MGKKIVHVINDFPTKSETFIVNHIVETIKCGYESVVLVNNLKPLSMSSQEQLLSDYKIYQRVQTFNPKLPDRKLFRVAKALGLLLMNIGKARVFFRSLNKKYGNKAKTLKMWYQAAIFLKFKDTDVFHGHFGICGKLLAEMKAIGAINSKLITTFYGIDTFSTASNRDALKEEYALLFHYSDRIITSSNYLVNNLALLNAPSAKIVVNPVGVDVQKFKYKERSLSSELRLVTVGRLIKLKGQHIGIKAVKILIDQGYTVRYTIVGDGQSLSDLKSLIVDLGLESVVVLKQSKTQSEVLETLYKSDLFLMTSTTDQSGRAEGQGLVTAEAQATGIPAIGFNCGGVPETIQDGKTGFIVEDINENALAKAIEKFLDNPHLINKMGENGRAMVEQDFNSKRQSEQIMNLYKAV